MSGMDRLTEREWLISLLTIDQEQMLTDYEVHPDAWKGDPDRIDCIAALADGILDGLAHRRASQAAPAPSDGLREAVDAAWNDAIEAAEAAYAQGFAAIRALRRAAPTEGEA